MALRIIRLSRLGGFTIFNRNFSQAVATTHASKSFTPLVLSTSNSWIWQQNSKIELPEIAKKHIELPNGLIYIPSVYPTKTDIEAPLTPISHIEAPSTSSSNIEKRAARLIVIRRKKMKKHKLKKLRKRMKFEYAKIRQRREWKKEKEFQAVLIQQCKEAEAFSAENYVKERIAKLNEVIIPRFWKGKRLPEFIIREKMGLPPK